MTEDNNKIIKKLDSANRDIDLTIEKKDIFWEQDKCHRNEAENSNEPKCALKNVSICPYFCGIEYLDNSTNFGL